MSRKSPESPFSEGRYYGDNARILFNQRCQTMHRQSKIVSKKDSISLIYFADKHKDEDDLMKLSRYISGDSNDKTCDSSDSSHNSPDKNSCHYSNESPPRSPSKYGSSSGIKLIPLLKFPKELLGSHDSYSIKSSLSLSHTDDGCSIDNDGMTFDLLIND